MQSTLGRYMITLDDPCPASLRELAGTRFDIADAPTLGRQILIVDHLDQAAVRADHALGRGPDRGLHRLRDGSSNANTARRLIEYVFE
jgi:hypothetical protein